jgi:hypothetical protein
MWSMRHFVRDNALSLVTGGLFLLIWLGGQSWAGHRAHNEELVGHGEPTVSFGEYLTSAHFGEATFENWESEFLQMGAYVLLTAWLVQRGSAESKKLRGDETVDRDPASHAGDAHAPWPLRRGGLALALYKNSLSIAFFTLFALSFVGHAVTGAREFNSEQVAHGEPRVSTLAYVGRSQFWFESLQNWQSEFMAVASIVVLSIFLRQQGSPESKPVWAPHDETGTA